ncbi:MAG TPA: hypothetical protein ENK89_00655, partial [Desulfobulbaceae bacterium]|nr:hypothetical protein [Desulfobulbaceae bacterium]
MPDPTQQSSRNDHGLQDQHVMWNIVLIVLLTLVAVFLICIGSDRIMQQVARGRQKIITDHLAFQVNNFIVGRFGNGSETLARKQP